MSGIFGQPLAVLFFRVSGRCHPGRAVLQRVFCLSAVPGRDGASMLLREFLCGAHSGDFCCFHTLGLGISLDTSRIPFTLHRYCRAWTAFIRAGLSFLPALRHGRPVRGSASLRPPGRIVGPPIQKRSPSCHVPTCCHPLPFRLSPRYRSSCACRGLSGG